MIPATLIFHTDFSNSVQIIMFLKNLSITGGFLVVAASGPGAISLDALRLGSKREGLQRRHSALSIGLFSLANSFPLCYKETMRGGRVIRSAKVARDPKKIQSVLQEIERRAGPNEWPIIGTEKGGVLAEAVEACRPRHVLEIGTLVGYSAILIGLHLPEAGRITTVEIEKDNAAVAKRNIRRAGLSDRIDVLVGPALGVIPKLEGPFDLLFLDAAKAQYLDYLKAAEPKLTKGAVVVADNVGMFRDAMRNFLDYVRNSGRYRSKTYDFGFDAVEVAKKTD